MRRILAAGMFALVACGPPLPPPHPLGAQGNPDDELVCKDEATTGTNMVRSVCLTRAQIDENRRAAQDWEKHPHNDTGGTSK